VVLLPRVLKALELVGEVEHLEQVVLAPARDPGERPALEPVREGQHRQGASLLAEVSIAAPS
jgi:hypothetical protein